VVESKRGIIAASAIGGVVVVAGIVFLLAPGIVGGIFPSPVNGGDDTNNTTTVASPGEAPKMLLVVLEGDEDSSSAVAQYEANNTESIQLASNAHVRFDSSDFRTAEGMKVIARDMDGGTIQLLRKSYDVNNEFFINLGKGHYELQVQASWFERGSFVYKFDIMVV
jgi:hypothetical protein